MLESSEVPDVPKSTFEESLSKLDLQATLTLLSILSERALYRLSVEKHQSIAKPKNILHI